MKVGIAVLTVLFLMVSICYAQSQSLKDALEYASTGDFSEARKKFEKILEASSGGLQEAAKEYLGIIEGVSKGGIKKETAIHIFKAINYSFNGRQDNAITEYKKAIDIDPSYILPHYYLATTYANNEMYKEAMDEYKKIINIDPNATRAYIYLAQAYAVEGKWDEVIPSLKKVIEITQDSAEAAQAHYGLAVAYYDKKQYQLAIKHCDEAIRHGLRIPSDFLKMLKPYREESLKVEEKTFGSSYPKITVEEIQSDIVGKSLGEGFTSWVFNENEPRDISIIESEYKEDRAKIIIDISTKGLWSGDKMSGRIRLHYQWFADEWNLVRLENLTFKKTEGENE